MKISKCKNGHFVDSDKYSTCPICSAEVKASPTDGKVIKKATGYDSTVSVYAKEKKAEPVQVKAEVVNKPVSVSPSSVSEGGLISETEAVKETQAPESGAPSLAQQILQNSNNNEGKTVGFFQAAGGGAPVIPSAPMTAVQSTAVSNVAEGSRLNAHDFVAGMLLCVKGPHFHECFAICYGRNSIGRLDSNDIVLSKDNSVSREKQGWINYDQKSKSFSVQPGESSKFMYVDDQAVMQPMIISPKAKIEVGDSLFVFVPFCDESFNWEEYQDK